MKPDIQALNEAEHEWISDQLQAAAQFVARHAPADAGSPLTISSLDRAFAAWMALQVTDIPEINAAINAVGVAFGSFLVREAGFSWVVASDAYGTELAVLALPGTANVLVYPASFVAKRWERKQTDFLEICFHDMVAQTQAIQEELDRADGAEPGAAKP
jgi:hypothetical protein